MSQKKSGLTKSQRSLAWLVAFVLVGLISWLAWLHWAGGGKREKDRIYNSAGRYLKKRQDSIRRSR